MAAEDPQIIEAIVEFIMLGGIGFISYTMMCLRKEMKLHEDKIETNKKDIDKNEWIHRKDIKDLDKKIDKKEDK